jgi:hypothetical protein
MPSTDPGLRRSLSMKRLFNKFFLDERQIYGIDCQGVGHVIVRINTQPWEMS